MLVATHTIATDVSRDSIWEIWTRVSAWPAWDHELEQVTLNGGFVTGSMGVIKPKKAPKANFVLVEVVPNQSFTVESQLPLTKLSFYHTLATADDGKTLLTHSVSLKGVLAPLFTLILSAKMRRGLPQAMQELLRAAQSV